MKMPTRRKFVIRLIAGFSLIGLAVFFALTLDGYTGPASTMLQRTIFIVSVLGLGLGGIGCMIFGLPGALGGPVFVLLITLPRVLPDPWNRYFSIVYLLLLFSIKPLTKWLSQRKAAAAPQKEPEPPAEEPDDDPILPGNSIVALNTFSGRSYQLFRRAGQIVGYRVGGELRGIDADRLRTTPDDVPDFAYGLDEIQKVRSKPRGTDGICINFRAGGHSYYFVPTAFTTDIELEDFFRALAPDSIPQKPKPQPVSQSQAQRRAMLSRIRTGLLVAIALIGLPWMFLHVPYKLFAALSLLPGPVVLILLCMFPEDTTLEEKPKNANGRIEMVSPLVFSGAAPCLRVLFDFNILDWPRLLIYAAIVLVLIIVALTIFNKPLRQKIGTLLCAILLCCFFVVGSVGQLNYLLDFSQPQSQAAQITDMHISTSSKGPDRYLLDVITDDGAEMELQVSQSEYLALTLGDQVTVIIFSGGLGIPYAFVG